MKNILVFGATGDQGYPLLRRLIAEGYTPIAALRDPDRLKGGEFDKIKTIKADIETPDSLPKACMGADAIAMHLPFIFDRDLALSYGKNIVDAAKAAGVKKIVFNTSCFVADRELGLSAHDGRLAIEQYMEASGVPFTVFRPVVFMDNIVRVWTKPSIVKSGVFGYPAGPELKISWICLQDVASFMVHALGNAALDGEKILIGGPEALTGSEVAERLSQAAGKTITFQSLTPDDYAKKMSMLVTGSDVVEPHSIYDRMAEFYRWYNAQPTSPLAIDMDAVFKKAPIEPTPMLEWAKQHDWTDPNTVP